MEIRTTVKEGGLLHPLSLKGVVDGTPVVIRIGESPPEVPNSWVAFSWLMIRKVVPLTAGGITILCALVIIITTSYQSVTSVTAAASTSEKVLAASGSMIEGMSSLQKMNQEQLTLLQAATAEADRVKTLRDSLILVQRMWTAAEYVPLDESPTAERLQYFEAIEQVAQQSLTDGGRPGFFSGGSLAEWVRSAYRKWSYASSPAQKEEWENEFLSRCRHFSESNPDGSRGHLIVFVRANFHERLGAHHREGKRLEKAAKYESEARRLYRETIKSSTALEQVLLAYNNIAYMTYEAIARNDPVVGDALAEAWEDVYAAESICKKYPSVRNVLGDRLLAITLYDTAYEITRLLAARESNGVASQNGLSWLDLSRTYDHKRKLGAR